MSRTTKKFLALSALTLTLATACEETPPVTVVDNPADAGCAGPDEPRHYEVYFALDVSGSMAPFLRDVRDELEGFVSGFPELDSRGRGVRVDYFVIGFVNDYKIFGDGRLSSLLAVQAALDEAITAGSAETNLTTNTPNVEVEENLLDALSLIPQLGTSSAAVKVVIIATDADFVENPAVLGPNVRVASTFAGVRAMLASRGARVHIFSRDNTPGLDIPFKGVPPLLDLPGSSEARLDELTGARERVRERLNEIARGAACDVTRTP
jgi:hypothetical protein